MFIIFYILIENKHAPEFEDTQQEITITKSHPIELSVTKVSAFDRDLSHCNGADCPCGDIQYKLENDFRIFKVNKFTGKILNEVSLFHDHKNN